jgi:hypothetical protein
VYVVLASRYIVLAHVSEPVDTNSLADVSQLFIDPATNTPAYDSTLHNVSEQMITDLSRLCFIVSLVALRHFWFALLTSMALRQWPCVMLRVPSYVFLVNSMLCAPRRDDSLLNNACKDLKYLYYLSFVLRLSFGVPSVFLR